MLSGMGAGVKESASRNREDEAAGGVSVVKLSPQIALQDRGP
jgi:hypothetical protein